VRPSGRKERDGKALKMSVKPNPTDAPTFPTTSISLPFRVLAEPLRGQELCSPLHPHLKMAASVGRPHPSISRLRMAQRR
jgi:hypothetical protein